MRLARTWRLLLTPKSSTGNIPTPMGRHRANSNSFRDELVLRSWLLLSCLGMARSSGISPSLEAFFDSQQPAEFYSAARPPFSYPDLPGQVWKHGRYPPYP